jgi:uncharacterized protein (DUF934 family)
LARVGFDAFAIRNDQNPDVALAQFNSVAYVFQNDWRRERSQKQVGAV